LKLRRKIYDDIIKGYLKAGKSTDALTVLEEAKKHNVQMTAITFYHIIRYYGLVLNNYELAINMYKRMVDEFKIEPLAVVLRLLMAIGGHNKDREAVMKYFWVYKKMYGKVDKITWRIFDKYNIQRPNLRKNGTSNAVPTSQFKL